VQGFCVIPIKNKCSKLNIPAAATASKILAKKLWASCQQPSQQGCSVSKSYRHFGCLTVVSLSSLKINNSQLTTRNQTGNPED
jgi:hypothetical protein